MKYLILTAIVLAVWGLLSEFVLRDRGPGGLGSVTYRLVVLGRRLHRAFGILALIIVTIFFLRIIFHAIRFW